MKLVVFTSALNEEETIGKMLDLIPEKIPGITEIVKLVVDDGSTDKTSEIAEKKGAMVLKNRNQKRLAFSFQKAVSKVLELEADLAVSIDADLQFDPGEIPKMVEPIINNEADFVAADRFTDAQTGKVRRPENMPKSKFLSNRVGSWVVSQLTGYKFPDVTCGFRAYNTEALKLINLNSKYTYTQETFQLLALHKLDIIAMPVKVKYYPGRKSRVVNNFFGFLFGSAINIIKAFRDFAPLRFFGTLGTAIFLVGLVIDFFVLSHFLSTGSFSPYIFLAFAGGYLNTLGIIAWIVGLMADMLDRIRNNQEKILYLLKDEKYKKQKR